MLRIMSGLFAGSAAMAGLVWAGRSLAMRLAQRRQATASRARAADAGWEGEALDDIAQRDSRHDMRDGYAVDLDGSGPPEALDDMSRLEAIARQDALHDMGAGPESEAELDTRADPEDIDLRDFEGGETVGALELPATADEPYDAVDAEDIGTAWLLRATQATPPMGYNPDDVLEGNGHLIELEPGYGPSDDLRSEDAYGSDREGAPLADHAGEHEEDLAATLPVGTVDAEGNAELRNDANPPDALDAPPTGQLSLTAEELARRAKE